MDSLIVLRRPLRKIPVEPKFIIPKKLKIALPKLGPIPPSPDSNEPPISFVNLYKEVCEENARRATCVDVHSPSHLLMDLSDSECENWPTRVPTSQPSREVLHKPFYGQMIHDMALEELGAARGHVNSPASFSASSLVTQYEGYGVTHPRVYCDPTPSSAVRAELILELNYDATFKDTGFC